MVFIYTLFLTIGALTAGLLAVEHHINPYPFGFVVEPTPCTTEELIVVVHSALENFERRNAQRYSWVQVAYLVQQLGFSTKTVFILGKTNNTEHARKLAAEQLVHNDILQADFVDSYHNNTYKAITYLRWVKDRCTNVKLVLKVDDDALISPIKLPVLKALMMESLNSPNPYFYIGYAVPDSNQVARDPHSPWYISRQQWPDDYYPPWFQGLAYMLSGQLAVQLPDIALDSPYLFVDDVYVGILVSKVHNVNVHRYQELSSHLEYGSTKSLYARLYPKFYHSVTVFYHVPDVTLYSDWWECSFNNTCPIPIYESSDIKLPLLTAIVILNLILFHHYYQLQIFRKYGFTINVRNVCQRLSMKA